MSSKKTQAQKKVPAAQTDQEPNHPKVKVGSKYNPSYTVRPAIYDMAGNGYMNTPFGYIFVDKHRL